MAHDVIPCDRIAILGDGFRVYRSRQLDDC